MQKLNLARTLLLVVIVLTSCSFAFAQETTGSIEGTVKDSAGALVPNVTLTINNAAAARGTTMTGAGAGFKRTITTNDEGFFRILQVPPGSYDVVTSPASGFGEARYENVTVAIGQTTQLAVTLTPGNNVTRVDIVATEAQPIDISNNAIQTTISAEKMQLIPKAAGFTGLLRAVPGTRPESRTGGFSVDGASGGENVFVIDGQEVTNFAPALSAEPTAYRRRRTSCKSSPWRRHYGSATAA